MSELLIRDKWSIGVSGKCDDNDGDDCDDKDAGTISLYGCVGGDVRSNGGFGGIIFNGGVGVGGRRFSNRRRKVRTGNDDKVCTDDKKLEKKNK